MGKKYEEFKEQIESQNIEKTLKIQELSNHKVEINDIIEYYKAIKNWESVKKTIVTLLGVTGIGVLVSGGILFKMFGMNYSIIEFITLFSPAVFAVGVLDGAGILALSSAAYFDIPDLKNKVSNYDINIDLNDVAEKIKEFEEKRIIIEKGIANLERDIATNKELIKYLDNYQAVSYAVNNDSALYAIMNDEMRPSEIQYVDDEWKKYLNEPVSFINIDYNNSVCDSVKIKKIGTK